MSRPYSGAAGTHIFFGLLSMFAGVAWICLFFFYEPFKVTANGESVSILEVIPPWAAVLLGAKIFCGFWFFVTGAVGCCVRNRGCTEGVFVALNVLNVIIWAPVLLLCMVAMGYIVYFAAGLLSAQGLEGEDLSALFTDALWLWAFPAVGALVAIVEFILSIVSYSIVCCCRPSSLQDGYEYQYEMK